MLQGKYNGIMLLLVLVAMVFVNVSYGNDKVITQKDLYYGWNKMSVEQRTSVYDSYRAGKPYDIGLTMAAINWRESRGGKYQISVNHDDFGIYQINIYWYLKAIGVKDTVWNRSQYSTKILTHPKMAEKFVMAKLINLLVQYDNNYYKAWRHYNGAKTYAEDIRQRVIFLRTIVKLQYRKEGAYHAKY